MTDVLMVISAADHWTLTDGTRHPTGFWAEEVAVPHRIFRDAGWNVTIATPGGRAPTMDQLSMGVAGGMPWKRRAIARYLDSIADQLRTPVPLDRVDATTFDLVFYPGGHGPMEDLAYDATSGALLSRRLRSNAPLALLCHAPAAVLATEAGDAPSPFAGRRMTGLSNREEGFNRFARKAPWLLEDRLIELGVDYSKGVLPLRPYVVVDGNLYTGQNPQSSEKLARRLIAELSPPALQVSVSRVIDAPREQLHAFVSDVSHMGELSPETIDARWISPGRRFVGRNRIGPLYRWSMTATVTENIPGASFEFLTDAPSDTHWRYTFADVEGGTLVTETMRKHQPQMRAVVFLQDISGARDRRSHLKKGMTATLQRLAERFERRSTKDVAQ
jgi:putative intracellular protease/amidase